MVRWVLQLIGALAVLLAAVPASAAVASAASMTIAADEHCADMPEAVEKSAPADDRGGETKDPCCVGAMHSCCPLAAALSTATSERPQSVIGSDHRTHADRTPMGAAIPPLSEPPILA